MALDAVLAHAQALARAYLAGVARRPVGAVDAPALRRPLAGHGVDPRQVLDDLVLDADPGLVASAGPRYFGHVVGGALPVAVGADWLVSAWDQVAAFYDTSPAAAVVEEVVTDWVLDLLGLPVECSVGFATGATTANLTCLAAARDEVLRDAGWDVAAQGLFGAPEIDVLVGDEVHVSVLAALRMLGLGEERVTRVPTGADGAVDAEAMAHAMAGAEGPAIVCAQAGNVDTGACDPLERIASAARDHDAWLHVDGAFGLWAAATPRFAPLVAGREHARSWATDAHKWLNVPYDCGLAIVRDAAAHVRATAPRPAPYLRGGGRREPSSLVPETSRRARAVPVYAALRGLGRDGVAELVERCCDHATLMAQLLREGGGRVLNDVVLNQVLVAGTPEQAAAIQAEGTCWVGPTRWHHHQAIRISFSSWATTEDDVRRSARAILAAL